jgi:hypothetical protein
MEIQTGPRRPTFGVSTPANEYANIATAAVTASTFLFLYVYIASQYCKLDPGNLISNPINLAEPINNTWTQEELIQTERTLKTIAMGVFAIPYSFCAKKVINFVAQRFFPVPWGPHVPGVGEYLKSFSFRHKKSSGTYH